jgi:hypothetical protein
MRRIVLMILFAALTLGMLLTACAPGQDGPTQAVTAYLQALVGKQSDKLSTLSCKAWEPQATLELDSFQAVTATLKDLSCKQNGTSGDKTLVQCQGSIVTTYNNENQSIDLSVRTYQVIQEGGDWRVCGYQ